MSTMQRAHSSKVNGGRELFAAAVTRRVDQDHLMVVPK